MLELQQGSVNVCLHTVDFESKDYSLAQGGVNTNDYCWSKCQHEAIRIEDVESHEEVHDLNGWFPSVNLLQATLTTILRDKQCWDPKNGFGESNDVRLYVIGQCPSERRTNVSHDCLTQNKFWPRMIAMLLKDPIPWFEMIHRQEDLEKEGFNMESLMRPTPEARRRQHNESAANATPTFTKKDKGWQDCIAATPLLCTMVPVAVRAATGHVTEVDPNELNQTQVRWSMLGDLTKQGANIAYVYVEVKQGERLFDKLAKTLRDGIWPNDDDSYCNYLIPVWQRENHTLNAINGDYCFWSERIGAKVFPTRYRPQENKSTGFYIAVNLQKLLESCEIAWDHTKEMFATNRAIVPCWFLATITEQVNVMLMHDTVSVNDLYAARAEAINEFILKTDDPVFFERSASVQTGVNGEFTPESAPNGAPSTHAVGTDEWFKTVKASVAESRKRMRNQKVTSGFRNCCSTRIGIP